LAPGGSQGGLHGQTRGRFETFNYQRIDTLNQPSEESIPENVRRFIIDHINTVEILEILLLLFGQPAQDLSAAEVSRRLYTSEESAAGRLNELYQTKLLVITPGEPPKYRFNAASPDSARVSELEKIYKERRVSVISFIYSKPSDPLRAFSDAFRLRKDEP
jgi:hypothetical protein